MNLNAMPKMITESKSFRHVRNRRLMQICAITALGLLVSVFVARGITQVIFAVGIALLVLAFTFAAKGNTLRSAYLLLWSMAVMLGMLVFTGAGLLDLAIMGYPCVLIMAVMLGNVKLFASLMVFILILCVSIVWLSLGGYIEPHTPSLGWQHLVFVLVIFCITGFSVYILVCDFRDLMLSLQAENAKAENSKATIEHLAHHDSLTNLPNRLYGEILFQQLLQSSKQHHQNLALMFIDLDNFKPVNDGLGHAAGDELLKQLAARLAAILPKTSTLIRFGGDEFLLLVPYNLEQSQLDALAKDIIDHTASTFQISDNQVFVSASIGIASAPIDGEDFKQLCRKADIAMYRAKSDGRNTYCHYNNSLDEDRLSEFSLLQKLRMAVREKQFVVYYQPLKDLDTQAVNIVEALLRWPQSDGSMIAPDQFIPLAESSGLINELGAWVINEACKHCAQLRQQGFTDIRVAVNLSVVQFRDSRLLKTVTDALTEFALPASALELELTESLLIDEAEHVHTQLKSLHELGVTIAIDDFGSGYSNLSYLQRFHAATLKIDRSFISNSEQWQANAPLVKAIIQMAMGLGMSTVAEGIENKEIAQHLADLGCNKGQGYYWSPAVPYHHLPALLASSN